MENFTNKDLKDFSDKLTEGYNRANHLQHFKEWKIK